MSEAVQTVTGTTVPQRSTSRRPPRPRELSIIRMGDVVAVLGALGAALATTGLLWTEVAPFTSALGYVIVSWLVFVVYYAVLVSLDENRPTMRDRVAAVVVNSLAAVVLAALVFVIVYTFVRGWDALVHTNFYTQDLASVAPLTPLNQGGVLHAMVGTLIQTGIAMGIAVPLGLVAAVYISQVPGRLAQLIRTVVDAMTAVPDILAGLFIYATLILLVTRQYDGIAASCALAVTAVPIVCRASDVVLRLVPGSLTEASYALGSGQLRTVRYVILPTARSGLATAVILGTARAIGETSPVLLTAGATTYMNYNPVNGPMMSLPLLAYSEVQGGFAQEIARGFGAAAVLLVLVLVLFLVARAIGGRGPGQLSSRQARRRAAGSRHDLARMQRALSASHPGQSPALGVAYGATAPDFPGANS
ncbi:MAG TPA: ABC transporter permease subunit [Trebonia sp.]|nr:ABC transporter permease subunit [Trebonia sp.]